MSGASGRAWRAAQQFFRSETWWVWCIAALKLALNMAFHGRYGYFRDELYYIACSDHLAWGYVDQPPLSVLILAATRWLFGDSLYAIRFVPALAGAGVVVLAGSMARLLGGKKFAQLLAAAAAALSPVILGNAARNFSMNAFDLFFWALLAWIVIKITVQERPDLWIWFGVAAGLGLLNKYSVGFFVAGLGAGLLLTAQRRQLRDRRFWLGALIAALLFLPHILWQVNNDFASLEFMRRAAGEKNVALPALEFLNGQFLQSGFAQSLLWLLGLAFFGFHPSGRKVRFFAWAYVLVFAVMILTHAILYGSDPDIPRTESDKTTLKKTDAATVEATRPVDAPVPPGQADPARPETKADGTPFMTGQNPAQAGRDLQAGMQTGVAPPPATVSGPPVSSENRQTAEPR